MPAGGIAGLAFETSSSLHLDKGMSRRNEGCAAASPGLCMKSTIDAASYRIVASVDRSHPALGARITGRWVGCLL